MPDVDILGEGGQTQWQWTPEGGVMTPYGLQYSTGGFASQEAYQNWAKEYGGNPFDQNTPWQYQAAVSAGNPKFPGGEQYYFNQGIDMPQTIAVSAGRPGRPGEEVIFGERKGELGLSWDDANNKWLIKDEQTRTLRDAQYWEIEKEIKDRIMAGGGKNEGGMWYYTKEGQPPIVSRSGPDSALFDVSRWTEQTSGRVMTLEERDFVNSLRDAYKGFVDDFLSRPEEDRLTSEEQKALAQTLAAMSAYYGRVSESGRLGHFANPEKLVQEIQDIARYASKASFASPQVAERQEYLPVPGRPGAYTLQTTSTTNMVAPQTVGEAKGLLAGVYVPAEPKFEPGTTREATPQEAKFFLESRPQGKPGEVWTGVPAENIPVPAIEPEPWQVKLPYKQERVARVYPWRQR